MRTRRSASQSRSDRWLAPTCDAGHVTFAAKAAIGEPVTEAARADGTAGADTRRPTDPDGATGQLCDHLARPQLDNIRTKVSERAEHLILRRDRLRVAGRAAAWSETAVEVITDLDGSGAATICGWDRTAPPDAAALLNGTFVHGFELDDYHQLFGPLHSEACVLTSVRGR